MLSDWLMYWENVSHNVVLDRTVYHSKIIILNPNIKRNTIYTVSLILYTLRLIFFPVEKKHIISFNINKDYTLETHIVFMHLISNKRINKKTWKEVEKWHVGTWSTIPQEKIKITKYVQGVKSDYCIVFLFFLFLCALFASHWNLVQ